MFSNSSPENCAVYEIMWKNTFSLNSFLFAVVSLKYFMSSYMFPFLSMDTGNGFRVGALFSFLQCFYLTYSCHSVCLLARISFCIYSVSPPWNKFLS